MSQQPSTGSAILDKPTIATILANYAQRYGSYYSITRVTEPWARVQYRAREVREAAKELKAAGSEPSHERDIAYDAWSDAMDNWRRELKAIEDRIDLARAMEQHSRDAA